MRDYMPSLWLVDFFGLDNTVLARRAITRMTESEDFGKV